MRRRWVLATLALLAVALILTTVMPDRPPSGMVRFANGAAHPQFREVSAFRRDGTLLGKGFALERIDMRTPHLRTRVAPVPPVPGPGGAPSYYTGMVAGPTAGGPIYFANGKQLYTCSHDGQLTTLLGVEVVLHAIGAGRDAEAAIGQFLEYSTSDCSLYFDLTAAGRSFLVRFSPALRTLESIAIDKPWPRMIDIHFPSRTIYWLHLGNTSIHDNQLVSRDFDGEDETRTILSRRYFSLVLSPNGKALLLSEHRGPSGGSIGIFDRSTRAERVLPVEGGSATWVSDGEIAYSRGENELWHFDLRTETETLWFRLDGPRGSDEGSYEKRPCVSGDGAWLQWGYAVESDAPLWARVLLGVNGASLGSVFVDLRSKEFLVLPDAWWHDVAWVGGARGWSAQ